MDAKEFVPEAVTEKVVNTFNFKLGSVNFTATYWQAAAVVGLVFLLFLTIARIRYLYVHWSLGKNAIAFLFWGFLLTIIVEAFFIIGGRTLFTEILGWKNPPKAVSTALDFSRDKVISVLGVTEEIPESFADSPPEPEDLVELFENMTSEEKEQVQSSICD